AGTVAVLGGCDGGGNIDALFRFWVAYIDTSTGTHDLWRATATVTGAEIQAERIDDNPSIEMSPGVQQGDANRMIAYASDRDGNWEIYSIHGGLGGGTPTRLTNDPAIDWEPCWSGDDQRIAFQTDRDGNHEIYSMKADGTDLQRLTNNTAFDGSPAWWAFDQIAFTSDRDGNMEIYVMDADGTNVRRVTNDAALDGSPAWRHDGNRIAFQSNRSGNFDIWAAAPDGSGLTQMTDGPDSDTSPTYTKTGFDLLLFQRQSPGGATDIYATPDDAAGLWQLTTTGTAFTPDAGVSSQEAVLASR
ncbi:MAG: hypothetical protein FJX74_20285, partial [Armatimonadetes bacterium]|nr:hypothetical protein [Armatimonadota bacterium]